MHDLQFGEASKIAKLPRPSPQMAACVLSEELFTDNARRAINLVVIPPWSFVAAGWWQTAMDAALSEFFSSPPTDEEYRAREAEIDERVEFHLAEQKRRGAEILYSQRIGDGHGCDEFKNVGASRPARGGFG